MTDQNRQALLDSPLEKNDPRRESLTEGSGSGASQFEAPAILAVTQFVGTYWKRLTVLSVVLLIPCFWHQRIEAGDLASHTYNAWLVQLIERGQAPGLWVARQWNNVFFDILLSRIASMVGLLAAEKIAVSIAVLIFFWGAFALVSAMAGRAPWFLVPCLLMFAYGWTLQMGFMNYYISLGLAFLAMALVERGRGWERAVALGLLPLTWIAHPLGVVLLVGGCIYLAVWKFLPNGKRTWLVGAATAILVLLSLYLSGHYKILWESALSDGYTRRFFGVDQLVLYGSRYTLFSNLFLAFVLVCLTSDLISRRKAAGTWAKYRLPLQLFSIALLSTFAIPSWIELPMYGAPLSLLTERLTSITAILGCCVLGVMTPKKWHLGGFAAFAALFFLFVYQDTGRLNRMESQAERIERSLPPGHRVVATIWPFLGSRVLIQHIVDRSCIGHCFSFGNYEPSSGQFRVRANPDNGIVVASGELAEAISSGEYVLQSRDLPMFQIYQCNLNMTDLCVRPLAAGEKNGRIGLHLVSGPQ